MAFNTNPGRQSFTASAGQNDFTFNFKIYDETDIKVYLTPVGQDPDDTADLLTYGSEYTVSIDGDNGGTVTLLSGATLNDTLVFIRNLAKTRDTSYVTNGDLKAATLNEDQDYQTYLIIDGFDVKDRAVVLPDTDISMNKQLPTTVPGGFLKAKADATGFEYSLISILSKEESVIVSDVNSLESLVGTESNTAIMLGYNSQGDGGGGTFYYDPLSQETIDNGIIFGALPTGRWKRIYDGFTVNVKWFGAVGNNIIDDTISIQAALDTGYNVYFPKGDYLHDGLIVSNSNITIYGDDATLIKKNRDDTSNVDIKSNLILLDVSNISIKNLKFNISDNQHSCIYIQKSEYISIENCMFYSFGDHTTSTNGAYGIHAVAFDDTADTSGVWVYDTNVYGDCKYIKISNCTFEDFGFGIRLQSVDYSVYSVTHSKINKCFFTKTWYESIEILYSNKNTVTECIFENVYNGAIDFDKGSSFCIASNNIIDGILYSIDPNHPEHRRFAGIKAGGADAYSNGEGTTRIAKDNIISNNIIKSASTSSFTNENPYGGIVSSIAERTIIEGNLIDLGVYIDGCDGVKLQGRNIGSSVTNNTIHRVYNGIATYNQKYNEWTTDEGLLNGIIIKDNMITDFEECGIWVGSVVGTTETLTLLNNFVIKDNLITDNHSANSNVSIEVTCNGAVVSNNTIVNNSVQKSFRVNGLNIIMRDNYMKDNAGSYSYIFDKDFTQVDISDFNFNSSKNEELTLNKLWQPINKYRRVFHSTQIPYTGYMNRGDLIINVEPSTGEDGFWIITTSGYACPGSSWSSATSYNQGETIRYSGDSKVYLSLTNSNLNNQPNISPTYWKLLGTPFDYKKIGTVGS